VVAPAILIAILTVGLNLFTDAIARVALGIERAEKIIAEAAGTGIVSEIPA
jgi:hypothetical protein